MNKVDRLGQLLGTLRQRVRGTPPGATPSASGHAPEARHTPPSAGLDALRNRIRQRIRELPTDDPSQEASAARVFVESVLVWEFGEEVLDDPEFSRVVERVNEQLVTEEELRSQLRSLLGEIAAAD